MRATKKNLMIMSTILFGVGVGAATEAVAFDSSNFSMPFFNNGNGNGNNFSMPFFNNGNNGNGNNFSMPFFNNGGSNGPGPGYGPGPGPGYGPGPGSYGPGYGRGYGYGPEGYSFNGPASPGGPMSLGARGKNGSNPGG